MEIKINEQGDTLRIEPSDDLVILVTKPGSSHSVSGVRLGDLRAYLSGGSK